MKLDLNFGSLEHGFLFVELCFLLGMSIHTVLVKIPFCALLDLILHMVRIVAKYLSEFRMDLFLQLVGVEVSEERVASLMVLFQILFCVIAEVQVLTRAIAFQFYTFHFVLARNELVHVRALLIEIVFCIAMSSFSGGDSLVVVIHIFIRFLEGNLWDLFRLSFDRFCFRLLPLFLFHFFCALVLCDLFSHFAFFLKDSGHHR